MKDDQLVHLEREGTSICRPSAKALLSNDPDDVSCASCRATVLYKTILRQRLADRLDAD